MYLHVASYQPLQVKLAVLSEQEEDIFEIVDYSHSRGKLSHLTIIGTFGLSHLTAN